MNITEAEIATIRQRHGMKAWAHILILESQRGRKLSRYQTQCITLAVGDAWLSA